MKPALITLAAICIAGCGPSTITINSEGVSYTFPNQRQIKPDPGVETLGNPTHPVKQNTGFTFFGEFMTLKVLNGNLTINGKNFGRIMEGDQVVIDKDGKVSVNGIPIKPL